jgi:hypothetical protein
MTASMLMELKGWLDANGVSHLAIEATGVVWKRFWHLLEGDYDLMLANADATFDHWCSTVADLDAQDGRVRQLARWLNVAALVLTLVLTPAVNILTADEGFVLPISQHLLLVALLVLPWLSIWTVRRFGPLYQRRYLQPLTPEVAALIMPGIGLTVLASSIYTVDWKGPLVLACVGGLLLTAAVAQIEKVRAFVVVIGLLTSAYGFGAGLELNAFRRLFSGTGLSCNRVGKGLEQEPTVPESRAIGPRPRQSQGGYFGRPIWVAPAR